MELEVLKFRIVYLMHTNIILVLYISMYYVWVHI